MQLSFQLSLQVCSLYFSCNIAASIEGNNERFLFSKTQKRELALLLHLKSPPSFQICHFCIKKKRSLWSLKLHVTGASALFHCLPEHSLTPSKVYIMGRPDLQGLTCSPPFVMRGQRLPRWSRVRGEEASVGTRQKPLQLRRGCFFSAAVCTQSCRGLIQRGQKVKLSIALIPSQAYYETECADTTCAIF